MIFPDGCNGLCALMSLATINSTDDSPQDSPIREFMLYDMRSKPEYEANIVAAEILLDNDELLDYIYYYRYSAEQIARAMHTDIRSCGLEDCPSE